MPSEREQIVAAARWGIAHTAEIHYAQVRPIPLSRYKAHQLPITTDCSGWVTCCYFAAGAPDPNGLGYVGQGNTTSLVEHLPHIDLAHAQAGDLLVYAETPQHSAHVVVLLEAGTANGGNPLVGSHGQEAGPIELRLSAENAGHPGQPRAVLRGVGAEVTPARQTWDVHGGGGQLLASTHRPARWAMRHWRTFRKHRTVTFTRRGA